jgi:RNA recognition motif-containing protein
MATKLYVGGIPYSTSQDALKDAFAQAGEVEESIILSDKMTGRSRGFGFVTMVTEEGANAAIDLWNGKELEGRKLTVNIAKPKEDRPPQREGGFRKSY